MNAEPIFIGAAAVRDALDLPDLIHELRAAFASGGTVPARHHHEISDGGRSTGTLLLMPAWQDGGFLGVKIATIHPANGALRLPAVHATYILSETATGRPLAIIDGSAITARRTIAVAALAADYCARTDATTLLIVGAGRIGALAHAAFSTVRPIQRVLVWNHTPARAEALVQELCENGIDAALASNLEQAVRQADIVSCATLSVTPLIQADWLRTGAHLDLIGSFTPEMREIDDACLAGARVFVDDRTALQESGDLLGPIACGAFNANDLAGTLADLCAGRATGRENGHEITVFKAVGTALADLAAAVRVYRVQPHEGHSG